MLDLGIRGELGLEDFDGERTARELVARTEHHAHAAGSEDAIDDVPPVDGLADPVRAHRANTTSLSVAGFQTFG